jgi:hypothetical protein
MRVTDRMAQSRREGLSLLWREEMLLPFGLRMPLGFGHAGLLGEVTFPKAVCADDMNGKFST